MKLQTAHNIAIRFGLTPLPFGTLLPSVATSYMLETLYAMEENVAVNNEIGELAKKTHANLDYEKII